MAFRPPSTTAQTVSVRFPPDDATGCQNDTSFG